MILLLGKERITPNTSFVLNVEIRFCPLRCLFLILKVKKVFFFFFSRFLKLINSLVCTLGEVALSGDGEFEGFTVYKGHPYCEACHVRLRLPKCKRCKRSIRDHDEAVEALGGKWCWGCFVCAVSPSFFYFLSCIGILMI